MNIIDTFSPSRITYDINALSGGMGILLIITLCITIIIALDRGVGVFGMICTICSVVSVFVAYQRIIQGF